MEAQPLTEEQKILLKNFLAIHDACRFIEGVNLVLYALENIFLSNPQIPTKLTKMILENLTEKIKDISPLDTRKTELSEGVSSFEKSLDEKTYGDMLAFLFQIHNQLYPREMHLFRQLGFVKSLPT